jgi:exodeoxyribonuclease-3
LRLLSLNVQRRGASWAPQLAAAILAESPDVVVLSEALPATSAHALPAELAAGGLVHLASGVAPVPGYPATVVVASRLPLGAPRIPFAETPFAQAALEVAVGGLALAAVYFPLDDERGPIHTRFWAEAFRAYADELASRPAVIAGDWNTGSWPADIGGGKVAGMAEFDELVAAGWTDAWRSLHPGAAEYSWHHTTGSRFRIDHALLSPAISGSVTSAEYRHGVRLDNVSDHSALAVDLAVPTVHAGGR